MDVDRPSAVHRPGHRRRHRHKDVGYSSSEGDNQSGYQSEENMEHPAQNGLGLTQDESAISPIENLDNTISRLYSYLSGSEGDLESPKKRRPHGGGMQQDQGTSPVSSAGCSRCSSGTESDLEQPIHHCSTLESRVTGENVYSRISDTATLPIPPIPPPPPLESHQQLHCGPPAPPRRAGEMLGHYPHHLLADPYSVSAIPHGARSDHYNEFETDFEPQFLVQTPSGNVFVPPVSHFSPSGSPGPPLVIPQHHYPQNTAVQSNNTGVYGGSIGYGDHGLRADHGLRRVATNPETGHSVPVSAPNVPQRMAITNPNMVNRQHAAPAESTPPLPPFRPVNPDVPMPYREKKEKHEHCSWKCVGVVLIILCLFLAAGCAFAVVSMYNLSKKLEQLPGDRMYPYNTSGPHPTSGKPGVTPKIIVVKYPLGQKSERTIPPNDLWRIQIPITASQHVKFNMTLPDFATIGVYGRRHTQPSFTQYDFFQPIDTTQIPNRYRRAVQTTSDLNKKGTAFVQYMERGPWYVFVYNDADIPVKVGFSAYPYEGSVRGCPSECHGHGDCVNGNCECYHGYKGPACSQKECPVVCSGHGRYRAGQCECYEGWNGRECRVPDSAQCAVPNCSGHGICLDKVCVCDHGFTGPHCGEEICPVECVHGTCRDQMCSCDRGWAGSVCDQLDCDPRCEEHGYCNNGTCVCQRGWNGKHCTLDGCPNSCSNHGRCVQLGEHWLCDCHDGWKGDHCQIAIEMQCEDNKDNDGDGMTDCSDPDCCTMVTCIKAFQCVTAHDPMEILLRKQPPSNTASFFTRMRFLVEDDSVQSYARLTSFNRSQVSVVRGKVVTDDGSPLLGVRVSVDTQPLYGFTLSRELGLFDLLVNGGGSVTLQFQRQPFQVQKTTILVPWNRMVSMPTVTMRAQGTVPSGGPPTGCEGVVHDPYQMHPAVVSTWQHTQLGACPDKSTIVPESQVLQESIRIPGTDVHLMYHSSEASGYMSTIMIQLTPQTIPDALATVTLKVTVEGSDYEQEFEADPGLKYKFAWDRMNAYNQKVYGIVTATIKVGYKYIGCDHVFWETQTATMSGYDITSSQIGGWNLHIHHTYNYQEGILHKGDGTNLYLKERPRKATTILGTGRQRGLDCRNCNGRTANNKLMAPVALASGRDGSLFVGDFNFIRKVTPQRTEVQNVLKLDMPEIPYKYFMTVSPLDGRLYISDYQKKKIIRLKTMGPVRDLEENQEIVAGTGDICLPGDKTQCGDNAPAKDAKLLYPKGIAINKDGILYFADGANIRTIDREGKITTLIGSQGQPVHYTPIPCHKVIDVKKVMLHWPTALAINPVDDTLHILDNNMVLKVTAEQQVVVVAGRPLHCPPKKEEHFTLLDELTTAQMADQVVLMSPQHIAFGVDGELFIVESDHRRINRVRVVNPDGTIEHYMGGQPKCDCRDQDCKCFDPKEVLARSVLLDSPTAITVTPDRVLHLSDMGNKRVYSVIAVLPSQNEYGNYEIIYPQNQEVYIFNRFGQHTHTKDIATGLYVYNYTYNVNSFYGKLVAVTDHAGQTVQIKRDYTTQVKEIGPPIGKKCKLVLDNLGQLEGFTTGDGAWTRFSYTPGTGLLDTKETSEGHTFLFNYDENGRLFSVILPTGEVTEVLTDVDASGALTHLATGGADTVSMATNGNLLTILHGDAKKRVSFKDEGALVVEYPWKMAVTVETQPHPLLDFEHELKVKRKVILPGNLMHRLEWRYYLRREGRGRSKSLSKIGRRMRVGGARFRHGKGRQGDEAESEHDVHDAEAARSIGYNTKMLTINGDNLLTIEYNRITRTEVILDSDQNELIQIVYTTNGQPAHIMPYRWQKELNVTYDTEGRPLMLTRGDFTLQNVYEPRTGFLKERKVSNRATFRYIYKSGSKPSDVMLPSGKQYIFRYDNHDNLAELMMPGLSKHLFRTLTTLGLRRFIYSPPETKGFYIQEYDGNGKLTHQWYPSGEKRVYYTYNKQGKLRNIVFDWTDVTVEYDSATGVMVKETLLDRTASNFTHSINTEPAGAVVGKQAVSLSSSSDQLPFKPATFNYSYDANFRVAVMDFTIADRSRQRIMYNYSEETGQLSKMKSFLFQFPQLGKMVIRDSNMDISREFDTYGRLSDIKYRVNNREVFTMEVTYNNLNRLHRWRRKVEANDLQAHEYDYDIDGNLLQTIVDGTAVWQFKYDANSNIQEITHKETKRIVEINVRNQVTSYDEKVYLYDKDGFLIQRNSENFEYNSLGLLQRASEPGKYDIRYFYDARQRLVARRDVYAGYLHQYFYANVKDKEQLTHIYNHNGKQLLTLFYDQRNSLFAVDHNDVMYYVAVDPMGSPLVIFSTAGTVVKQMSYNPMGTQVTDSAPQFFFPLGYKKGILDSVTGLVHLGSRVYDPTLGRWIAPDYASFVSSVPSLTAKPELANLYQYRHMVNARDAHSDLFSTDLNKWMEGLGYNIEGLLPKVTFEQNFRGDLDVHKLSPFVPATSAFECAFERDMRNFESLSAIPKSSVKTSYSMIQEQTWKPFEYLFGPGVVLSSQSGRLHVTVLDNNVEEKANLATQLLNNTQIVDLHFTIHGRDTHYLVHSDVSQGQGVIRGLNLPDRSSRAGINIEVHRFGRTSDRGPETIDIRLHGNHSVFNIRFGTTRGRERTRILNHAKERAVSGAWALEKSLAAKSQNSPNIWDAKQKEELLQRGEVSGMKATYIRSVHTFPQLADDPKNIKFELVRR